MVLQTNADLAAYLCPSNSQYVRNQNINLILVYYHQPIRSQTKLTIGAIFQIDYCCLSNDPVKGKWRIVVIVKRYR